MSEMDDLTTLLLSKTMDGKVSWSLEGEDSITTRQGKNVVEVSFIIPEYANILVRNQDGIVIVSEQFAQYESSYDKLLEIFRKAKRLALKVDETLNDISSRLRAL